MSGQKTEKATPQRKNKAREKGDGVRSRELLSALSMLGGFLVLGTVGQFFVTAWAKVYRQCLRQSTLAEVTSPDMLRATLWHVLYPVFVPVALILLTSFAAALFGGLVQNGGMRIYAQAIQPKFARLNPAENIKNLVSLRSAVRLGKSLAPAMVMLALGAAALKDLMLPMPVLSQVRLPATFSTAYRLGLQASWVMLAWSGLDYAFEWRSWNQRLKMSKQEIRDENREAMGNPEIKGRIRQIQRAMRRRKVKADLSRATVVITNPTHYAVALEFSFDTMAAPTLLVKGRDLLAAEIREEARWAGIPIIENPPLARSIYRTVEPGQSIPFQLYAAVAGILAYLYRQKVEERARRERQLRNEAGSPAANVRPIKMYGFGGEL